MIDSLQEIVGRDKNDSLEASALVSLADEFVRNDLPRSKKIALQAVSLSRQLRLPYVLSGAYTELAMIHLQANQPDSTRYYVDLLRELAEENKVNKVRINYNQCASLYYHKQGNYKAALPYMLEALRLSMLENSTISVAGQSLNIGNCYVNMGEYKKAMDYHLKAMALFEKLGNKRGLSFCLASIGSDFLKMNQFAEALPYAEKSLALKSELNDTRGRAVSYSNIGEIQEGLGDYEKALKSYMESLALDKEMKSEIEEAKLDLNIGRLYEKMNDIDHAREYVQRGQDLFRQSADTAFLAIANAQMASLLNHLSRQKITTDAGGAGKNAAGGNATGKTSVLQDPTEKVFFNTLSTSIRMGDKKAQIDNYKYLSGWYAKNKQYDKALEYNEKFHQAEDSLENTDLQLQVKRLEQQYSLEKKEQEIALLKKDRLLYQADMQNQRLFRYGEGIVVLLLVISGLLVMARYRVAQKAKRLLEIEKIRNNIARNLHDDIGSAITSINILSKVALKQEGGNLQVTRDLEKIKDRSSLIMENMGDIVWAINPANDPLDKTILKMKEFAAEILESAGIDFVFTAEGKLGEIQLGVEERKNFYLIFKEVVNNMVKYSGATSAEIVLKKDAGSFSLTITDNGRGFDATRQYTGNGLKNIRSRVDEMKAGLRIDSSPGIGTRIEVAMPLT